MLPVSARILRLNLTLFLATFLCFITTTVNAGTTGKLVGRITDKETGEPVITANVVGVDQIWGASTDLNGEFLVLNITPGIYELEVSHLDYHTIRIKNVIINIDVTSTVDVELTPASLKLEQVTVIAKKPVVKIGLSHHEQTFNPERLENLRVSDIESVISSGVGFKVDREGRFHVRGSREGEVAIIIDGVDFRDPLVSTGTNLSLSSENISEVNILTGGANAEYGRFMGGVLQVSTIEGKPKAYNGVVKWETDRVFNEYSNNWDRGTVALGGPVPFTRDWLNNNPITFYLKTTCELDNTYTPFDINRPANDYMGIGIKLPERQSNGFNSSLLLAYQINEKQKLTLKLTNSFRKWDIYPEGEGGIAGNYGYAYKYNLDNRPWAQNEQYSAVLTYKHQLSQETFYEVKFITYRTHSKVSPRGKTPGEFTLDKDVEDGYALAFDINRNGKLDPEEYSDFDGNGYMDGYIDANGNYLFDGGGEGYEDLNQNGRWDRGEDWVDLNGNGIYDAKEPYLDVVNPLTGENNLGVYDPWDTFADLNGNGRWDSAEPQLPEHDWNGNGIWDGERFNDANSNGNYDPWEYWEDLNGNFLWDENESYIDVNGNGKFDYSEGYDDMNSNGRIDRRDLAIEPSGGGFIDRNEPYIDGDYWWDTGEPFIDEPDPITGGYNGRWDKGEIFYDLPSSLNTQTGAGYYFIGSVMTLNGQYDGPNFGFDEYELFTRPADWSYHSNPSTSVVYNFDPVARGRDWPDDLLTFIPGKSTWINRTLHDEENPEFNFPDYTVDTEKEWWLDYNNDGVWNSDDGFLNPDVWDPNAYWYDRTSTEYTIDAFIKSQVTKHHLVQTGLDIKFRDLEMQLIRRPNMPYTGEAKLPPGSPWPDRGGARDFYRYRPMEGAFYAQDKMEFEGLIVNAGIRVDFIKHDNKVVDEFRDRLERDEPGAILATRGTWRTSPRLGISHPITEKAKLYFNYGHFYQAPQFQYFYRSATANFDVNSTIGNPNLEYEKTVQYELGVNTEVSEDLVLDISGYYKDQYDLISTSDERWKNLTLDRYVNLDYGRMRGFELSIRKQPSHHWALTFNYDYSYAYGKASDQHANREARLDNVPYNWDEHPLDWDETHKINANMTINYAQGAHPRLFGLVLPDNWNLTVIWEFGSGTPYTPSMYLVGIDNQNLVLPNSNRLPWHEETTLHFDKYYSITLKSRLSVGFSITNLFNKKNVNAVYSQTGNPKEAVNPLNPAYNPFQNRKEWEANPRNYDEDRRIIFRMGFEF